MFEHNFPETFAWIILLLWINKKFGPKLAEYVDKEVKVGVIYFDTRASHEGNKVFC